MRLAVAIGATTIAVACGGSPTGPADGAAQPTPTAGAAAAEDSGESPEADEPATVHMERSRFGPRELTVAAGQRVTFVNDDPFAHTVTARPDGASDFDSGVLDEAGEFEISFETPGTYAYFCQIHPTMRGTIVVE